MVNVGKYSSPMDPMNLAAFSLKKSPNRDFSHQGWFFHHAWHLLDRFDRSLVLEAEKAATKKMYGVGYIPGPSIPVWVLKKMVPLRRVSINQPRSVKNWHPDWKVLVYIYIYIHTYPLEKNHMVHLGWGGVQPSLGPQKWSPKVLGCRPHEPWKRWSPVPRRVWGTAL